MSDADMDYWKECISIAADDCGAVLTEEQIECLASSVSGGHENYSMAFGHDVADRNFISDEARELARLKKDIDAKEQWVLSTRPCKHCTTTGIVLDGWGRDQSCGWCNGKGRH
jgi:hypothetical protein